MRQTLVAKALYFLISGGLICPAVLAQETPIAQPLSAEEASDTTDTSIEIPAVETEPDLTPNWQQNLANSPFQQQSFVPNISLILDLGLGGRSLSDQSFGSLTQPLDLLGTQSTHHSLNPANGFNLNYAELSFQSTVDTYFDLFSVFHFSALEVEIEEAYLTTRGLPANFQIKAGKFLSHFGRQNSQHAHFWRFNDQPQIYRAFFGNEGLNELGLRASWLAPTDFYLDLGLELLQGDNASSFGHAELLQDDTVRQQQINLPSLIVATAKSSFDLNDTLILSGGLSYALGATRISAEEVNEADLHLHQSSDHAGESIAPYAGLSQVVGADLSLRWFYSSYQELSWQNEILLRHSSGQQNATVGTQDFALLQSGLYSELLWRFGQQWRSGLRLDLITLDQRSHVQQVSGGGLALPRYTAVLDYLPTEFSRFRLQYAYDQSRYQAGQPQGLHELFLTLNLAIGAHGAHEF